jgi:hypothetical protein
MTPGSIKHKIHGFCRRRLTIVFALDNKIAGAQRSFVVRLMKE